MKFSIIVPVYNTEEYIERCIMSVLNQEFYDYELILVNDGSTDNSGTICQEFELKDSRIKVFNKINSGVSDSRNVGLEKAVGEYIIFLDSDDELCPHCLVKINEILTGHDGLDILFATNENLHHDKKITTEPFKYDTEILKGGDCYQILENLLVSNANIWAVWRHVVRRQLIIENSIFFNSQLTAAEDCDWFVRILLISSKYDACNISIIKYRMGRDGSITNNSDYKALESTMNCAQKWHEFFKYRKPTSILNKMFANLYCDCLALIVQIPSKYRAELIKGYVKNELILNDVYGLKHQIFRIIYKIFGCEISSKILNKLFSFKK